MGLRKVTRTVKVTGQANILNALSESMINDLGGFAWRNNTAGIYDPTKGTYRKGPASAVGSADVLCVYRGQAIAIETKVEDSQSLGQKEWQAKFEHGGGWYFIVKTKKQIEECKNEIIRRMQSKK